MKMLMFLFWGSVTAIYGLLIRYVARNLRRYKKETRILLMQNEKLKELQCLSESMLDAANKINWLVPLSSEIEAIIQNTIPYIRYKSEIIN